MLQTVLFGFNSDIGQDDEPPSQKLSPLHPLLSLHLTSPVLKEQSLLQHGPCSRNKDIIYHIATNETVYYSIIILYLYIYYLSRTAQFLGSKGTWFFAGRVICSLGPTTFFFTILFPSTVALLSFLYDTIPTQGHFWF